MKASSRLSACSTKASIAALQRFPGCCVPKQVSSSRRDHRKSATRLKHQEETLTRESLWPVSDGTGSIRPSTIAEFLVQPVPSSSAAYGITRTLYVLAVGVPAIAAQTFTVTTPEEET
jgi:hypothetical protein